MFKKENKLTEYKVAKLHNGITGEYTYLTSYEQFTIGQVQYLINNIGRSETFITTATDGVVKSAVNLRFYSDVKFYKDYSESK